MKGPFIGHIRGMLWLFLYHLCLYMPEMAQIFTVEPYMPNKTLLFNVILLGPCQGHVLAILGPCFGYSKYICFYMT